MKSRKIPEATVIFPKSFSLTPGVASTPAFRNDVIVRGGRSQ